MARGVQTDFYQGHMFWVQVSGQSNRFARDPNLEIPAGFTSVSAPSVSVDAVEYREGTMIYTRKQPGLPTFDDITMERGVSQRSGGFVDWMTQVNEGTGNYKEDLQIWHFHRAVSLNRPVPRVGGVGNTKTFFDPAQVQPGRKVHLFECQPSNIRVMGDLDGTGSDISIESLTVSYEFVEVEELPF